VLDVFTLMAYGTVRVPSFTNNMELFAEPYMTKTQSGDLDVSMAWMEHLFNLVADHGV